MHFSYQDILVIMTNAICCDQYCLRHRLGEAICCDQKELEFVGGKSTIVLLEKLTMRRRVCREGSPVLWVRSFE